MASGFSSASRNASDPGIGGGAAACDQNECELTLGFRLSGLGILDLGIRIWGFNFEVICKDIYVFCKSLRVWGSRFRVWGLRRSI